MTKLLANLLPPGLALGAALAGCTSDLGGADPAANCVVVPTLTIRGDDDLAAIPSSCFGVDGTLELSGTTLTDLTPLADLVVAAHLRIEDNRALASFAGLENVQVLGDLIVAGNPALGSIEGLEATRSLGRLELTDLPALTDLRGLANLVEVRGDAIVEGNDGLRDLDGLGRLQAVGGTLSIRDDRGLTSLAGLDRLEAVRGMVIGGNGSMSSLAGAGRLQVAVDLQIVDNPRLGSAAGMKLVEVGNLTVARNPALTRLGGFDVLQRARGSVTIEDNDALGDIDGFSGAFLSIAGILAVRGNGALTQATGLANLKAIGGGIIVVDNPRLSQCRATAIRTRIPSVSGGVEIRNNSTAYNPC